MPVTWCMRLVPVAIAATLACCRANRPADVPQGAVPVSFSSSGGWAYCWFDSDDRVNRCRTYAADGRRLYRFGREADNDDVFLRYQGSGPVPQDQLKIDVVHTSPDFIWLENGVVSSSSSPSSTAAAPSPPLGRAASAPSAAPTRDSALPSAAAVLPSACRSW
jgi:hypothetical protein